MWRWLSGLPRAIRQHFHGHRASTTGVCREDDVDCTCNDTHNVTVQNNSIFGKCEPELFGCSSRSEGKEKSKNGPDQDKWYRNYKKDFCSFFNGNCHTLEALGWGAAVVLGIHLSKWPTQTDIRRRRPPEKESNHCLLWQVAYAWPDLDRTARKSIVSSDKKIQAETRAEQKETDDPLYKVMNEFEVICKKYAGIGKNIQGLQEAAKSHMNKAVSSFIDASHLGYTKAQFNLGLCYETGKGVNKNLKKAVKYYKLAAEEGHSQALYNLALLYLKGEGGIDKNVPLALELLLKAADNGLMQAQTHLGVYYTEEETQDLDKAVAFFKAAADQNDPEAQYFLGICYEEGWGVEINTSKSAELYGQSASTGHDGALYNLGVFNELGLGGLPKDRVQAIQLYQMSADAGNEQAMLQLDRIKAQAAVEEWKYLNPETEEHEMATLLSKIGKEIQEEKKLDKDESSIKLSLSLSSPSLTDYVRNHLSSFSSTVPYSLLDPISLLKNKPSSHTLEIIVSSSSKNEITDSGLSPLIPQVLGWKPQYGSTHKTTDMQDRVSFSLGADEDDLEGLTDLNLNKDSLSLQGHDHASQIHHFCSFIQKNSTMPNLQCVSCN